MDFFTEYKNKINKIDGYINEYLEKRFSEVSSELLDSMKYSVLNGGKRLRSILCTEICTMLDGDYDEALPFASAIEFIHAYSLVHDDLPAMDNSDYRRGQLSCHKKFGETMGILCGDALLNASYELMAENCTGYEHIKAMQYISRCAGACGMIDGQVIDLSISTTGKFEEKDIIKLIELKTMKLIKASVMSGALISKCNNNTLKEMETFAYDLGMAFQIRDDFEDAMEDKKNNFGSPNLVNFLGEDKAKKMLSNYCDEAFEILSKYTKGEFLRSMHKYLFK